MSGLNVAVLGGGSWGATLAHLISKNGNRVTVWTRRPEHAEEINKKHTVSKYLEGFQIHPKIKATTDMLAAVKNAGVVVMVIPSQQFRQVAKSLGDFLEPDQPVLHATKGIEISTGKRMSEVIKEETSARFVGVISGPNLFKEILADHPSATVIASSYERVIALGPPLLAGQLFRVYANSDVLGVELGAAFKNIFAIAAGVATGFGYGDNTKAFLVTRGLAEMTRLGTRLGAQGETFTGLAGLGDLMVTCAGMLSRNFRVGFRHAKGEKIPHILNTLGAVAEGVPNSIVAKRLADSLGIEVPLITGIHSVIHGGKNAREAMKELLSIHAHYEIDRAPINISA